MRNTVSFYLNGEKKTIGGEQLFMTLSSFLRYEQRLTGTKVVCAEGDCGACTVMSAKWQPSGEISYHSINSCIAMTFAMDGANLVTVEGLSKKGDLCEVQNSMIRNFGGQCGFCTPGFVMSITNMHEHKKNPSEQNVKNYLTGNLCRCTGYTPIIKAALDVQPEKHQKVSQIYKAQDLSAEMTKPIHVKTDETELFAPITIEEACRYKFENPDAILFSGSTDLGVQINKGKLQPRKILSLHLINELYDKTIVNNEVSIGARITLTELQKLVADKIFSLDEFLNIFASPQIKNAATVVGNLANASPIADTTPILMALDAVVGICGLKGHKEIELKDFYLGYKKLKLEADEIITHVKFKIPAQQKFIRNYKISQRRDLDISTVNACFYFDIQEKNIQKARIALGGVAATTLRVTEVEKLLEGKALSADLLKQAKQKIADSVNPLSDVRGSAEYRKILVQNLFEKFVTEGLGL